MNVHIMTVELKNLAEGAILTSEGLITPKSPYNSTINNEEKSAIIQGYLLKYPHQAIVFECSPSKNLIIKSGEAQLAAIQSFVRGEFVLKSNLTTEGQGKKYKELTSQIRALIVITQKQLTEWCDK